MTDLGTAQPPDDSPRLPPAPEVDAEIQSTVDAADDAEFARFQKLSTALMLIILVALATAVIRACA